MFGKELQEFKLYLYLLIVPRCKKASLNCFTLDKFVYPAGFRSVKLCNLDLDLNNLALRIKLWLVLDTPPIRDLNVSFVKF